MYLDRAKEYLSSYPDVSRRLRGCTYSEIQRLRGLIGSDIPQAYVQFLRWFGRDGGIIYRGSDFAFDAIIGDSYEDWLEEGIVPVK